MHGGVQPQGDPWRIAGSGVLQRALPKAHWDDLGLLTLSRLGIGTMQLDEPPDAGPHVRWYGRGVG